MPGPDPNGFLDQQDLIALTARKNKRQQIAQLRKMGVPFVCNFAGTPLVPISAIEGTPASAKAEIRHLEMYFAQLRAKYRF